VVFDIRKMVHECMSFLGEMRYNVKYMLLIDIIKANVRSERAYIKSGSMCKYIRKLMHSCIFVIYL
jgi:hypothetical protein